MTMRDYEAAVELMSQHQEWCDFEGKRDERLVQAAERALGLAFPPTYRRFLLEFGAGSFGSAEFYGVIRDDFERSSVPDAVWFTLNERRRGKLPPDLIGVGGDDEALFFVEAAGPSREEGRVIGISGGYPLDEQPQGVIAGDFGEYFLRKVQLQTEMRSPKEK